MHKDVKELRAIVKPVDGAWVRRWKDGSLWAGIGPAGFACDLAELHRLLVAAGWSVVGMGGNRSWVVERR